jgi:hypothetical protein
MRRFTLRRRDDDCDTESRWEKRKKSRGLILAKKQGKRGKFPQLIKSEMKLRCEKVGERNFWLKKICGEIPG